jgi:hypothetical protein
MAKVVVQEICQIKWIYIDVVKIMYSFGDVHENTKSRINMCQYVLDGLH